MKNLRVILLIAIFLTIFNYSSFAQQLQTKIKGVLRSENGVATTLCVQDAGGCPVGADNIYCQAAGASGALTLMMNQTTSMVMFTMLMTAAISNKEVLFNHNGCLIDTVIILTP